MAVTLHFSRQMASLELQRKAPAGAESGDSALQGTIVLRPSRTISSGKIKILKILQKLSYFSLTIIIYLNLIRCSKSCAGRPCRTPGQ